MPLQQTSGNNTADAYGVETPSAPVAGKYIEDYFRTWVRSGTGASATITTGINATTNAVMLWIKTRTTTTAARITDTIRGASNGLTVNGTNAQISAPNGVTSFTSNGYTVGTDSTYNASGQTFVDWSFAATPKFFDMVTYTGNATNRTIAHNLGSVPGCIIVRPYITGSGGWVVYHKGIASPAANSLRLNTTAAPQNNITMWNNTAPTASVFSIGTATEVNTTGTGYIAYIFADNAGGFGEFETDNVISCGSFTTDVSRAASVNLGYEIQWILAKPAITVSSWVMYDVMRDMSYTDGAYLVPNTTAAEVADTGEVRPTAVGFDIAGTTTFTANTTYIYIAIRRGPMRVPTDATKVFSPIARTGTGATATVTTGFVTDAVISAPRAGGGRLAAFFDRLRGPLTYWSSATAVAETSAANTLTGFDNNTGFVVGAEATVATSATINRSGSTFANWCLQRAPGFFDESCYTGTGVARTVAHNLGVVPELIIFKNRVNATSSILVQCPIIGSATDNYLIFDSNAALSTLSSVFTTPTTTTFGFGSGAPTASQINASGNTYIAYLFATCPGVSKVGSYTGTGATQTISCGFSGGARFVIIKRTNGAGGDWYVWDTARGMVSGTDPSILFNSTAAEVNANSVYTTTGGFQIVSTAVGINASGSTYIFLAIA